MAVRPVVAPFWPASPRPRSSADPAALAALARLVAETPAPAGVAECGAGAVPDEPTPASVRAGGRIVGVFFPFPADGGGPVYAPARGPSRIRELVDDGIIA